MRMACVRNVHASRGTLGSKIRRVLAVASRVPTDRFDVRNEVSWRERGFEGGAKRRRTGASSSMRYLFSLTLPFAAGMGIFVNPILSPPWNAIATWSGATYALVCLPLLDAIVGRESPPRFQTNLEGRRNGNSYHRVVYLYACIHVTVLLIGILCAARLDPWPMIGSTVSLGVMGGLGYTTVHELIHGRATLDHFLASSMLCLMWAMHWKRSHMLHHKNVGKGKDPSTARRGENFYSFLLRSMIGNVRDGVVDARAYGNASEPVWWALCPLTVLAIIIGLGGWKAGIVFVGQAWVAALMLETVNYIQHYGLVRKEGSDGKYGPCSGRETWDGDWKCSNALAFNLQHHADHHLHSSKPYHELHSIKVAPVLPVSYPLLMLVSLIPPLFFRIMDEKLDQIVEH